LKGETGLAGINIQFPISRLILTGSKTVETRTYPIPKKYIGVDLLMIETPGKEGNFKARVVGTIRFEDSFEYSSKSAFYRDSKRHRVTQNSKWAWSDKTKWGWPIRVIDVLSEPREVKNRIGIKFTKNVILKSV
jgi:hypothetical protein